MLSTIPTILIVLILLAGLALVLLGSDALVDGSSDIARRSGMSEFVIGLTIVGIGTSTPEMVVSWLGAIKGNADIAVGNIIGSNIFNTFLILGVTAFILPISISKQNKKFDIPLNILVTVLLIILGLNYTILNIGENQLSRVDGIFMLLLFVCYLYVNFRTGKTDGEQTEIEAFKYSNTGKAILFVLLGLAGLVAGGRLFVDSAHEIAIRCGLSDKFIAITVLALGTSLPELVTCIVAAAKKKGQLALGNIIGSNIANILLILGGASVITPLSFNNITLIDMGFVLLASIMLLVSCFTFKKNVLDKYDGAIMIALFAAYMYLLVRAL